MTSANVTEVSKNYFTNGNTKKSSGKQGEGFESIMNLTSSQVGLKETAYDSDPSTKVEPRTERSNEDVIYQKTENHIQKTKQKDDTVKSEPSEDITQESREALTLAAKEAVTKVAEELGVSEDEVMNAMEELGMQLLDILNTNLLTGLVTSISGDNNSFTLLTNEQLYSSLKTLTGQINTINTELCNDMQISAQEMQTILDQLKSQQGDATNSISENNLLMNDLQQANDGVQAVNDLNQMASKMETDSTSSDITSDQTLGLQSDDSAGEAYTQVQEDAGNNQKQPGNEENHSRSGNDWLSNQNTIQNQSMQTVENVITETFASTSDVPDGIDIIRQISDYMNLQAKEDLTEMELQLNPANLGTIHLTVSAKAGVITANIETQNEAVKNALEAQVIVLKENLENQGVKVEAVEVTVASHEFERNLDQGEQKDSNEHTEETQAVKKSTLRRIDLDESDVLEGTETLDDDERLIREIMKTNGNTVDYTA